MKKIKLIYLLSPFISIFLSTAFVSCKKSSCCPAVQKAETPAPGPLANASVKSFSFSTGYNWKADSCAKNYSFRYHIADLNTSALQDGMVMLYLNDDLGTNGSEWKSMPSSVKDIVFSFKIELSSVEVFVMSPNGKMPVNPGSQKFKLVIVMPAS